MAKKPGGTGFYKTIVSKANFLLLDEPTNHLDLHSVELLIEALNKCRGQCVLVSHDRYFISKIANKIWEIEIRKIVEFKGTYKEWEDWKEEEKPKGSKKQKPLNSPEPVQQVEKKTKEPEKQSSA